MSSEKILIIGAGHLAGRTKNLVTGKGYWVTHIKEGLSGAENAEATTLTRVALALQAFEMESFKMTFVLFEKDEQNLEWVIALMALFPDLPVTTTLFNENIRPHLEKANPGLCIYNPAKIAAPFFVKAIENVPANQYPAGNKNGIKEPGKSRADLLPLKLILAFATIAFGAVAYFHFHDHLSWIDSLYFVVVTITTVGYGDINLYQSGTLSKVIGILLILCSAVFIWLIFSLLIDRILKNRGQRLLGRKKYNLRNHIILCGLGRLGHCIAEELRLRGEKIIIIESNEESAGTHYFRSRHIDVYNGNARHVQVLQDAGAANCKALISVINNDAANLEIGLNARHLQPGILLVLRIYDESMAEVIREKFGIHLTQSMSFICAGQFAGLLDELESF